MSLKYNVEQVTNNHFVLPKVGTMKCHVDAFLNQNLYEKTEENLWNQAYESASYEGAIGMYLMPDCHLGYSIPVGGVLVTENTIVQAGSGYDISCGVIYAKTDLAISDVVGFALRKKWVDAVDQRIATGYTAKTSKIAAKEKVKTEDILRYGAKALGISEDKCERQYIPIPDIDLTKISKAYDKCNPQLGSVGGGNHFIELQAGDDGNIWIMIHCGSRGYGWQTANHFFYAGAELRGLPSNRREQSWLYADEELGREYWAYHNSAANYAIANRHLIVKGIREATQEVLKTDIHIFYEISHNLVQEETLVLPNGETKKGFVHRKGATRAFPSGHPSLKGTKWEDTGHPVLIPGSMYDGAAILYPKDSYKSGCSVNHGSGRLMARGQAKRELETLQSDIDAEMREVERTICGINIKGIATNTEKTPLDECGHVYKSLDEVLSVLEQEGIAKIDTRLWPIANIKGCD